MASPHSHGPGKAGWLPALLPLVIFIVAAARVPASAAGERLHWTLPWVPSLGVGLGVTVDGLSLLFVLIVSLVGAAVFLFAGAYLGDHPQRLRFYGLLAAFMVSMLGLVLVDNLLALFVFWELTTLSSYLLIGFEHHLEGACFNARQALLTTGAGGLAMLAGILMLAEMGGSSDISHLVTQADRLRQHPLYLPTLACIFAGALTKSAQFPFHFWLPNAMSAPTPISAFLHSATMVKAGIYLLARLHPVLGGTAAWMATLVVIGAITALLGALLAVSQQDLKRMMAYTTIMALGVMTMFLGGRTTPTLTAAITFLMVHALYKSALFLVVGAIDHQAGSRHLHELGGLGRAMPLTGLAAAAAALSMAGFPLFFGFIGKEIMYQGALTEDLFPGFATAAALVSNALMTAVAGIIVMCVFAGRLRFPGERPREAGPAMWLGPLVLGGLGVFFGTCPDWVGRLLVEPAVMAFHPRADDIHLKLFHGFNMALLLSAATLVLGAVGYFGRRRLARTIAAVEKGLPVSADGAYARLLHLTAKLAGGHTRIVQNGSLQRYLTVIFAAVALGAGWPVMGTGVNFEPLMAGFNSPAPVEILLCLLILGALAVVVAARSRLLAVCALGLVGAGSAMIFLWHGAPDVALTQLLVETLTVIIVALVLLRLPPLPRPLSSPRRRVFNAVLSLAVGAVLAGWLMAVAAGDLDLSVTAYYEAYSTVKAHGRNIVNVILVDFRSFDTLGEIIVVAVAGLAGHSLIRRRT
ncbi:MAG: hydrogen gas-evolving membrane-bound hydrogenase subunit E [Desulfobacteraceae bacterium]|nr:hydrogen gas-evolving membrane-bound hydrogenase subunit E [Desulfobacteraceae bacterium]